MNAEKKYFLKQYLSGEGRPIGLNVGRQSVSQFTLFKIGVCLRQTYVLQHISRKYCKLGKMTLSIQITKTIF